MSEDKVKLLESLQDATKRKIEAQAAKKRDTRLHNDNIAETEQEISDIMEQLESLD